MKAVIQRVSQASVSVDGQPVASIGPGLLVLLGVHEADTEKEAAWMAGKIVKMRLFPDETAPINRSVMDAGGDVLVISQFTLLASNRKGNRPSFNHAARPEVAVPIYESVVAQISAALGRPVPTGTFGAHMHVSLTNEGPVTIVIDSREDD